MDINVFLVDDHAVVRDGLRALLEVEPDIRVVGESGDGREAVRRVTDLCPDVVLMDIRMPELNGIEATAAILRHCPTTRVIILSMHGSREHIARALRGGARGYVLKESAGAEVTEAVRTVHAGGRYLCRKVNALVMADYAKQQDRDPSLQPLDRLSSRERQVLQLVVEGQSNREIAEALHLSVKSIETYRSRMMQKLGIENLPALVKFAIRQGLIPLEP